MEISLRSCAMGINELLLDDNKMSNLVSECSNINYISIINVGAEETT